MEETPMTQIIREEGGPGEDFHLRVLHNRNDTEQPFTLLVRKPGEAAEAMSRYPTREAVRPKNLYV